MNGTIIINQDDKLEYRKLVSYYNWFKITKAEIKLPEIVMNDNRSLSYFEWHIKRSLN